MKEGVAKTRSRSIHMVKIEFVVVEGYRNGKEFTAHDLRCRNFDNGTFIPLQQYRWDFEKDNSDLRRMEVSPKIRVTLVFYVLV